MSEMARAVEQVDMGRFSRWRARHYDFLLLLALFISLRLFLVIFTRGGGLWLDYSDYWWYYQVAALSDEGYLVWRDFWSDYPPLFYAIVVPIYRLAALLPAWSNPALWFYVFFGSIIVLAESTNFVLLYWLARRLYPDQMTTALRPLWLYAGLFGPLFVVLGYFDQLTLLWLLLSLVLVVERRYVLSAIPAGIGFMIKLFPILIAPAAFKLASWRERIGYGLVLLLVLFLSNLPFYLLNPTMFIASWRAMVGQPSWETVWALLDGYYSLGMLVGNRFDPGDATAGARPERLPWFAVLSVFSVLYLLAWFRPWEGRGTLSDSERVRRIVSVVAFTVTLFFLFSKGWSPQFIAWLVPFTILLLPNGWGVGYALLLSLLAVLERIVVFLLLPQATWPLEGAIYLRTALLVVLTVEFAAQAAILPSAPWRRWRARVAPFATGATVLVLLAGVRGGLAEYRGLVEMNNPYRTMLEELDPVIGPDDTLITTSRESFHALSSLWPGQVRVWPRENLEERPHAWARNWAELLGQSRTVWLLQDYRGGLNAPWNEELARRLEERGFLSHDRWLSEQERLLGYIVGTPDEPWHHAPDGCFAGMICIEEWQSDEGRIQPGEPLRLVISWHVEKPPATDLTMFAQLLAPDGQLVATRDVPLRADGRPPHDLPPETTATTRLGLLVPETLPAGEYTLVAGLYDPASGVRLQLNAGGDALRLATVGIG